MNAHAERRVSRITVTRASLGGVSRTEVRIVEHEDTDEASSVPGVDARGDCFDPASCCSEREQAMIAALRAYLRPNEAPECLKARVRAYLDHCCGE